MEYFYRTHHESEDLLHRMTMDEISRLLFNQLPQMSEIESLKESILSESEISYERFRHIMKTRGVNRWYGSASFYFLCSTSSSSVIWSEILCQLQREALYLSLAQFSRGAAMTRRELKDWLLFLAKNFQQTKEIADKLLPWWVETAAETFLFFLGKKKFQFEALFKLEFLVVELLDQNEKFPIFDIHSSRFSRYRGIHYGEIYMNLKVGENMHVMLAGNFLNKKIMKRFFDISGRAYPSFVQWLGFCIPLDNRSTPQAASYFFDLLDEHNLGKINEASLVPFIEGLYEMLQIEKIPLPSCLPLPVSLAHEFMDLMGKPEITKADAMQNAENFGIMVGALVGHEFFLLYETRDEKAQERASEKLWKSQMRKQATISYREKLSWAVEISRSPDHRQSYENFIEEHTARFFGQTPEPEISQYYEIEQAFQESLHASFSDQVAVRDS